MYDLISVIVPVYNVEDYLKQCIESIINQIKKLQKLRDNYFLSYENEFYVEEIKFSLEDILDKKYGYQVIASKLKGAVGCEEKTHEKCPNAEKKYH